MAGMATRRGDINNLCPESAIGIDIVYFFRDLAHNTFSLKDSAWPDQVDSPKNSGFYGGWLRKPLPWPEGMALCALVTPDSGNDTGS